MSYSKLKKYAVPAVGDIIPVDSESCKELVDYCLTLPSDQAIQDHLIELLGQTEISLAFISKFLQLKQEEDSSKHVKPKSKSPNSHSKIEPVKSGNSTNAWAPEPVAKEPRPVKGRLDTKKSSTNTSELLDLKPSNQLTSQQAKKTKKKNLDNLKDIEAVLNELELEPTAGTLRKCNCMATRHPLYEIAPNCLNCGKIICAKEGLQPCSYCGHDLLNVKEKMDIMNILKQERNELDHKQENIHNKKIQQQSSATSKPSKSKKIVVTLNAGENLWKAQDRALKEAEAENKRIQEAKQREELEIKQLEEQEQELKHYERTQQVNPELLKAQERLETLLNFQSTGAERTKIIDNAADYDLPSSSNTSTMWLSPVERALQLKKQQKQLRKHEGSQQARSGRGKVTVEMVIKDGKVKMVERTVPGTEVDSDDHEIQELESVVKDAKALDEMSLSKNVWDPEKDKLKWEKPVYIGTSHGDNRQVEVPKGRVQFNFEPDQNELLVAMP